MSNTISINKLETIAISGAVLNGDLTYAALYNSNCECNDSDGCDGDCGGDGSD